MKGIKLTRFDGAQMIVFSLSSALLVALIWATTAHAQRPIEFQHEVPKVPSGPALGATGVPAGGGGADGSGGKPRPVSSEARRVLSPPIGGPLLLVSAGMLAASGAGVVLLRRSGRGS
jgi:hypothetical protein